MTSPTEPDRPPDRHAGPNEHAEYTVGVVRRYLHAPLTARAVAGIRPFFARLGPDCRHDLASWIFLETLEKQREGGAVDDDALVRIADRVRQRIIRDAAKRAGPPATLESAVNLPPDDEADLVVREFGLLLRGRSAVDAALFQAYYLDGVRDVARLAADFGLASSTIYRKLAEIRNAYMTARDLHQPPHAAD